MIQIGVQEEVFRLLVIHCAVLVSTREKRGNSHAKKEKKETLHTPSPSYTWSPSSKVDAKLIMKRKSGELARLNVASQSWLAL